MPYYFYISFVNDSVIEPGRLWFTLTLSHFYLCVCVCVSVCVCVCVSARFLKNGWTNLHEIFTQNAYGATPVSFGVFGPTCYRHFLTLALFISSFCIN